MLYGYQGYANVVRVFVGVKLRQVRDLEKVLRSEVGRLEPADVPLSEAPAMWQCFEAIERLAAAAKTLLAERVDESRAWAREGDRSSAEYLARKAGTSVGAARAGLAASRQLRGLPHTRAALRRGELSRPQAESISDAAAHNPGAERQLIDAAGRTTLTRLREECGRAKAAGDPDAEATHRRLHRERRLRRFTDAEGGWNLQARGTPDAGARVNAALEPIIDDIFITARRAGRHENRDAYAFDALLELAHRAQDTARGAAGDVRPRTAGPARTEPAPAAGGHVADAVAGAGVTDAAAGARVSDAAGIAPAVPAAGATTAAQQPVEPADPATAPDPPPRRSSAGNPRYLGLLRIDVEALVRGRVEGNELCEITGVGPIPVRVARGLLGDAILKLVITRGVDVASVTHLGRGPTAAQRIAALWTTPGCTNTGCSNTLAIQHDHREPWTQVHETTLDNLDRLCPRCHRRKTHHGWALVAGQGRRPLVPPDDPRHPNNTPPPADDADRSPDHDRAIPIEPPSTPEDTHTLLDTDAA
jgi:hypothetical protein